MQPAIKIHHRLSVRKAIVVTGMMLLLLYLTGINFLYSYADKAATQVTCTDTSNDDETASGYPGSPAGPDEKSPNAPVSITEEFIHEHINPVNPLWVNMLFQHQVHETEKLCVGHPKSFSPPPEA